MKHLLFFISLLISVNLFAAITTDEVKIDYLKEELPKILATQNYELVARTITLSDIYGKVAYDILNIFMSGDVMGDQVDFQVRDLSTGSVFAAHVFLFEMYVGYANDCWLCRENETARLVRDSIGRGIILAVTDAGPLFPNLRPEDIPLHLEIF